LRRRTERVYYEFFLSRGQLVATVIVLLICAVTVMSAGIWIGFRAGASSVSGPGGEPVAQSASLGRLEPPTPSGSAAQQSADRGGPAGLALRAESSRRVGEPVAGPAGGSGGIVVESAAPSLEPPRAAAASDREGPLGDEAVAARGDRIDADPPAASTDIGSPRSTGRREGLPSRRVSQTAGSWVVQVLASSDENQATLLSQRLKVEGYPAFVSVLRLEDRTHFRVRVGTYSARREAERVASELRRLHGVETWIVQ
jgi:cell division septation protein DedD